MKRLHFPGIAVTSCPGVVGLLLLLHLNTGAFSQTHFQPVDPTGQFSQVVVQSFMIEGQNAPTGSEVGLFDGPLCVGATVFTGQLPFNIAVIHQYLPPSGGMLPGAVEGHPMDIHVWNAASDSEFCGVPSYEIGDGYFTAIGGLSVISVLDAVSLSQVTNVSASDTSCSNIIVTWSDVENEDGYVVHRDGVEITIPIPDQTSYTDTPDPGTYSSIDLVLDRIPSDFYLEQNYPNPFNPATTFEFGVPKASHVTLRIYDILGRQVDIIVDGMIQAGHHQVIWNCRDCTSGVYFVVMSRDGFDIVRRKAILIK